jgi:hypothetical protein
LKQIRMRDPAKYRETNVSRTGYHPLWQAALTYLETEFGKSLAGLPVRVVREERKRMVEIFNQQLRGGLISLANVCSIPRDSFTDWVAAFMRDVERWHDYTPHKVTAKWEKSEEKYRFLSGENVGWANA